MHGQLFAVRPRLRLSDDWYGVLPNLGNEVLVYEAYTANACEDVVVKCEGATV